MKKGLDFCYLSTKKILSIVEPLMENCLEGSNEGDHEKHVRDFTDRMKNIVTPEELQKQLSGKPRTYFTDRQFMNVFRRRDSVGIVWKQSISSCSDELINQAIFKEVEGKVLIDHCMIC